MNKLALAIGLAAAWGAHAQKPQSGIAADMQQMQSGGVQSPYVQGPAAQPAGNGAMASPGIAHPGDVSGASPALPAITPAPLPTLPQAQGGIVPPVQAPAGTVK